MISLIILAAGLSTRFGRNKLLEAIAGMMLIERVVTNAIRSKADEVIVVLGHETGTIEKVLVKLSCRLIYNPNYRLGQTSSVKVGLSAVNVNSEAAIVLPGDIAGVLSEHVNLVIDEFKKSRSKIVISGHEGRMGHPILFDRSLFDEIMKIDEKTEGLKQVISRHRDSIRMVEAGSDRVLVDFDTVKDLENHRHFFT